MAYDLAAFQDLGLVALDQRGRGSLVPPSMLQAGLRYRKYLGPLGELLFLPEVDLPQPEAWLHQNPEALAALERGIADVLAGRLGPVQDFSAFLDAAGA